MRLDALGIGLALLVLAGTGGAVVLLVAPGGPLFTEPGPCPEVQLVRSARGDQVVFEVDQAKARSTLSTWVHLDAGDGSLGGQAGFWNLHDAARAVPGEPSFQDLAPQGIVSKGDRFVVPGRGPVGLVVFDDSGRGIGGLGGCGSTDLRVVIEPAPGACYGIHLVQEEGEDPDTTLFRVAGRRGVWYLHELDWHLHAGETFASGHLTALVHPEARPMRFEDTAPLAEVSVGDRFVVDGVAEGVGLVEASTGRSVGGSWTCL